MLLIALGWDELLHADFILIGVSSVDYSGYPDCRPEYINAFEKMANLVTRRGVEGLKVKLEVPLLYLSKAETAQLGMYIILKPYPATKQGRKV